MATQLSRLALAGCVGLLTFGCASQQTIDPSSARAAVYSTEFQTLFQEVALEVKKHYPNLAARPNERMVKTAWHQLPFSESVEAKEDPLRYDGRYTSAQGKNAGHDERRNFRRRNTTQETKHFVRFDVAIVPAGAPGGAQWQVKVTGQASVHDNTGIPVELKGEERPYWLDGRIAKLEVAIHERVKRMAVASRQAAP